MNWSGFDWQLCLIYELSLQIQLKFSLLGLLEKKVFELKLSIDDYSYWVIVNSAWQSEYEFGPTNIALECRLIEV